MELIFRQSESKFVSVAFGSLILSYGAAKEAQHGSKAKISKLAEPIFFPTGFPIAEVMLEPWEYDRMTRLNS